MQETGSTGPWGGKPRENPVGDDAASRSDIVSALTTEHAVLQAAASATVADAAARSSLYVFALSSSLVAIGFSSRSPEMFLPFAAAVLPAIFLLGVFTIIRLVDTALENNQALSGIARVRAYYRTLGPEAATLFAADIGRWPEGRVTPSLGLGTFVAFLGTTAAMIAFINSIVAGAGIAVLVDVLINDEGTALAVVVGIAAAVLLMAGFFMFQRWRFASIGAAEAPPDR
jgi:hypothetical protein